MLKMEQDRIVYEYDGETLWVEPWGENSLRVRCFPLGSIDETLCGAPLDCIPLFAREGGSLEAAALNLKRK